MSSKISQLALLYSKIVKFIQYWTMDIYKECSWKKTDEKAINAG